LESITDERYFDESEDTIEEKLEVIFLQEGLSLLPDAEAAVIGLNACGFKQSEISLVLGISRTTVWNKQTSGIKTLRRSLQE